MTTMNTDVAESQVTQHVVYTEKDDRTSSGAEIPFLAEISHELRAPLTSILGMIDLALSEELAPDVRDYLKTARDSSEGLLTLLDKTLDFFRIGTENLELDSAPFSAREVMEETVSSMRPAACEKGLRLLCAVRPDVPAVLLGDPLRLQQVLVNLVSNAIKFTEEGQVALHAVVQARDTDEVRLELRVVDTGIGVSLEDQRRIFLPFVQAKAQRRGFGAGLGLAITRRLVESMGGRIEVKSQPGVGSQFCVAIPFALLSSEEGAGRRDEPSFAQS